MRTIIERFEEKYKRSGPLDCWEWHAANAQGYGIFWHSKGMKLRATHASLLLYRNTAVPQGKLVMHLCDNPKCINPEHLQIGTQFDNMRDAARKGRTRNVSDWKGIKNPKAKLTASQQSEVAKRHVNGEPAKSLAMQYGITDVRVWQLARQLKSGEWQKDEV